MSNGIFEFHFAVRYLSFGIKFVLLSVKILFSWAKFLPAWSAEVAQIFNLLYRRIAFGRPPQFQHRRFWRRLADCKSAIQQNAILRYLGCGVSRAGFIRGC